MRRREKKWTRRTDGNYSRGRNTVPDSIGNDRVGFWLMGTLGALSENGNIVMRPGITGGFHLLY